MLSGKLLRLSMASIIASAQIFSSCNNNGINNGNADVKSSTIKNDTVPSDSVPSNLITVGDTNSKFTVETLVATIVHKPDTLLGGYVTLATPMSGDGKNGNDSHLDLDVKITTTDGTVYYGTSAVRDNSGIGPGNAIYPPLTFREINKLNYDNIASISLIMPYWKDDYQKDIRQDSWKARAEVVLYFKNKDTLATGYNDPAPDLSFTDYFEHGQHHQWTFFNVPKSLMYIRPTLKPPFN